MRSIFTALLKQEIRNPLMIILLVGASIGITLLFTGGIQSPTVVYVYSEEESNQVVEDWTEKLNTSDSFSFVVKEAEEARQGVKDGHVDLAIRIIGNDYRMLTSSEFPEMSFIEQHVQKVFQREARLHYAVQESSNPDDMRNDIEAYLEKAPLQIEVSSIEDTELSGYDIKTQLAIAFTLLVAMFIIGFRINHLVKDRVSGVRNRILLSPISKTKMYLGYISYSMMIGLIQSLIIFAVLIYIMKIDFGENLAMLVVITFVFSFSMTSVAMLITGMTKTPEQFLAIYPSVIPLIPILSGAYMMPGTFTNPVLNFIGDLFPLSHAMDAYLDIVFYNPTWLGLLQPIAFMLLIGVIAMGIGINLMERRSA